MKKPKFDIGDGRTLIDYDLTASIDGVEVIVKKIGETLEKIRNWRNVSPPAKPRCSQCGSESFNTAVDGREVCVKCGLEKKT